MDIRAAARPGWAFDRLEVPGGYLRTGTWHPDGPPRGTCVLLSGRSEFMEKYTEQAADWAARGWRVVGWDWRGQGLSSRDLPNPHKGHVDDFDRFLDDAARALAVLVPAGTPGPVVCFAHSMGAHITARLVAERSHPFAALVLSAPMLGIRTGPLPKRAARFLASFGCTLGLRHSYAPGQMDYQEEAQRFEGNVLTSDRRRFHIFIEAYRDEPRLMLGGVTFGWLRAAFRSMDLLWKAPLERVELPILVLSAGDDRVVCSDLHGRLARRLRNAVLKTYAGAEHELMMERDEIRDLVWADIDAFLATAPVRS